MSHATSDSLLEALAKGFPRVIALSLRPDYLDLLRALGNPQEKLPPVIHVAGTNGKGSTCAFLRAILEAAGKKVHVYTSPHLVHFHERIRLAGELIDENALVALLQEVSAKIKPDTISQFEAITAAAFKAFAETPADFLILETGLGGRYDATNVIGIPLASVITRISYDHREYLGATLKKIAGEKAGIIKSGAPCFIGEQKAAEVLPLFQQEARKQTAPLFAAGQNWRVDPLGNKGFRYNDASGSLDLPMPALLGTHQISNAALAIATLRHTVPTLPATAYAQGLRSVRWAGRLQQLQQGTLHDLLPTGWELWLDGGHNDSAGEVLAEQAMRWQQQDGIKPRPLFVVYGMLNSKKPQEFLAPLTPHITALRAVTIPNTPNSLTLADALLAAKDCHIPAAPALDLRQALQDLARSNPQPARILVCGSLYLVGYALNINA